MLRREPDPLLLSPAELRAGMLRREPDPLLLSPGLPCTATQPSSRAKQLAAATTAKSNPGLLACSSILALPAALWGALTGHDLHWRCKHRSTEGDLSGIARKVLRINKREHVSS